MLARDGRHRVPDRGTRKVLGGYATVSGQVSLSKARITVPRTPAYDG